VLRSANINNWITTAALVCELTPLSQLRLSHLDHHTLHPTHHVQQNFFASVTAAGPLTPLWGFLRASARRLLTRRGSQSRPHAQLPPDDWNYPRIIVGQDPTPSLTYVVPPSGFGHPPQLTHRTTHRHCDAHYPEEKAEQYAYAEHVPLFRVTIRSCNPVLEYTPQTQSQPAPSYAQGHNTVLPDELSRNPFRHSTT